MAEQHMDICSNDVWLLYVEALNQAGQYEKALEKLLSRQFTPCEGGEGSVTGQYMFATCSLAQKALDNGDYEAALDWYSRGMKLPESLGAGLWNDIAQVPFQYGQAVCLEQMGEQAKADVLFDDILSRNHPDGAFPLLEVYMARILMRRKKTEEAEMMLQDYLKRAKELTKPVDAGWYAATAFYLCFIEPAKLAREASSHWLQAAACEALNRKEEALWLLESCIEKDPQNLNAHFMYAQLKSK